VKALNIRLRAEANQDLKDIHDWIVAASGHRGLAEKLVDRIFERCGSLAEFPLKGRARDDLLRGVRILPFEHTAVIAYRITASEIEVLNVFYAGRDYESSLLGEAEWQVED